METGFKSFNFNRERRKVILSAYIGLSWFTLVTIAGVAGIFDGSPGLASIPLYLTVSLPIVLFGAGYLFSAAFRYFIRSIIEDPWAITLLQSYRVLGVIMAVLAYREVLPAVFGLSAGWGDFLVGLTAPLAALAWSSGTGAGKALFILWNVLGLLDMIMAVSLGILASTLQPGPVTMASIRFFPLSLIPTFAVPLSFILHIAALGQYWYLSSSKERQSIRQALPV